VGTMTIPATEVALSGLTLLRIVNSLVVLQCSVQADEVDVRSSRVSASDALVATSLTTTSTTWTTSAPTAVVNLSCSHTTYALPKIERGCPFSPQG
jgi:hypothetical protein